MAKKNRLHLWNQVRRTSQLLFLVLFLVLVLTGKSQMWLILFAAAGLVLTPITGRAYCGWICPMGTLLRYQTWMMDKLNSKRKKPNQSALNGYVVRIAVLAAAVLLMMVIRKSGRDLPLLLYITGAAVLISFFVHESFWHRKLCPFGTLLSLAARISPKKMAVSQSECIGCGKCEPVCPNQAIVKADSGSSKRREIIAHECFLCNNCRNTCPVQSIHY